MQPICIYPDDGYFGIDRAGNGTGSLELCIPGSHVCNHVIERFRYAIYLKINARYQVHC
jgi:hypothetical protein